MLLNIFKTFSHPYQSNCCNWRTKEPGFALLMVSIYLWKNGQRPERENST
jgi:hypothetical protein